MYTVESNLLLLCYNYPSFKVVTEVFQSQRLVTCFGTHDMYEEL